MKRPDLRHRLRASLRRQLYSFFSSLGTLFGHRLGTALTVLVLGIAMALPLGLHVALQNLRDIDLRQDEWGAITVFLQPGVTESAAQELIERISARPDASATGISPEAGLAEFREASGFGSALDVLESNPLPWVLEVRPQPAAGEELASAVGRLANWLESQDRVEAVVVDHTWLQRLAGILDFGRALVTLLTALFSVTVLVVVANTIRLDVANRADEIEVLSLVGASNAFIRLPFLYSGFWYGLFGGAVALLLLQFGMAYVKAPLQQLIDAYGRQFQVSGLGLREGVGVILGGGMLGVAGAWISVGRYLRALQREALAGRL